MTLWRHSLLVLQVSLLSQVTVDIVVREGRKLLDLERAWASEKQLA